MSTLRQVTAETAPTHVVVHFHDEGLVSCLPVSAIVTKDTILQKGKSYNVRWPQNRQIYEGILLAIGESTLLHTPLLYTLIKHREKDRNGKFCQKQTGRSAERQ